jgi:hypothetical protein
VIARRLAPFAGAALLGYLVDVAPGAAVKGTELTVSVLIAVVITIGGILCPWGPLRPTSHPARVDVHPDESVRA